jgi:hypothetical protein
MKTINWKDATIAGITGTILFDIVGFIFTGQWWDTPALLAEKTGIGIGYGILAHYGNGMLLAILYAGIAPSLWGPHWLRPFIFITAQTIVLVWFFMMPLLGAGVAGSNMGPMMAVGSLIRHWIFAMPFIFFINYGYITQQDQKKVSVA